VAGKTGTAQKVKDGRYGSGRIASFIGFFPADRPRAVLLVVVDEPTTSSWGGTVAAPVFAEIGLQRSPLGDLFVQPVRLEQESVPEVARPDDEWIGLSLREALVRAREMGVPVEVLGSGYVVRQDPPPGIPLVAGQQLRLELARDGT
jgi:cell division protein FtsI (penicillin-binding protein 3)